MNIAMFTNTYVPHVAGVARSVDAFTKSYRRQGHKVLVITPRIQKHTYPAYVLPLPALPMRKVKQVAMPLPIPGIVAAAVQKFSPDIIHAHHPFLLGNTALMAAQRWQKPLVFTYHTMYEHYTHYGPTESPRIKRLVQDMATGYANLCDCIFAPTPSVAKTLRQRAIHSRIEIVPTGIDVKRFREGQGQTWRRRLHIPADAFVIGSIGRLAPEKNAAFLLKIFIDFLRSQPQAHALVAGDGPLKDELINQVSEAKLSDRLHFTGMLQNQDLINAYHTLDTFVFASQSETQGLVLLEALAAGTPILALDAPGAHDFITPNLNGWLVPKLNSERFRAKLHEIVTLSSARQRQISRQAQRSVRQFDLETCAKRALTIYDSLRVAEPQLAREIPLERSPWAATWRVVAAEWELWSQRFSAATAAFQTEEEG